MTYALVYVTRLKYKKTQPTGLTEKKLREMAREEKKRQRKLAARKGNSSCVVKKQKKSKRVVKVVSRTG